ncbi:MAG: hypothetical protein K0R29_1029 [Pseudobdellovibrio sp.]|nr:hypothetical protein [Pseudobdellovibrio sp.]
MKLNVAHIILFFSLFAMFASSCTTIEIFRSPASYPALENLLTDHFSLDGYDQSLNRKFVSGKIPDEQLIKELAGRAIWFKSAPNERHHAYVFPQKFGVALDWNQSFASSMHDSRFQVWGLINDPDCCVPGKDCDQKGKRFNGNSVTLADTFGWEYCSGDEELLNSLRRKTTYRDPSCDDKIVKAADEIAGNIRENRCELQFGTSAGAVGYRKFPNPSFNAERWRAIGGWQGYSEKMIREGINNSIQPPFRIGKACASCHASFDPLNPPVDVNHPSWANIKGETGNQYLNVSKLLASGMSENTLESQLFTHARPGTVDTSAIPHDFVNNPGTINAITNFPARPLFEDTVTRWNEVSSCNEADANTCRKVLYKNQNSVAAGYKYWKLETKKMQVPHILKGGEDSVGYDLAVQRVYLNTGMCAEQCWLNHLTDLKELDYSARNYGQTPFDIAQCRQDCASFRANEDRVDEILSYLVSRRPTDLKDALKNVKDSSGQNFIPPNASDAVEEDRFRRFVETRYGSGSIEKGRKIFSNNCAKCHSSQNFSSKENLSANENNFDNTDYHEVVQLQTGEVIRKDWLGNDKSISAEEAGTYKCRSLHSNHMSGRVWEGFSSDSYKALPAATTDRMGRPAGGGRGYYRNISLLSVWAHAPFMHNNSVGPEICGNVRSLPKPAQQVVKSTLDGKQLDPQKKNTCDIHFDPSVMGRLQLFEKSVDELLMPPQNRRKKIALIDVPVKIPLGLKNQILEIPAGIPLNAIANLDFKALSYDLLYSASLLEAAGEAAYQNFWNNKFKNNSSLAQQLAAAVKSILPALNPGTKLSSQQLLPALRVLSAVYQTCENSDVENSGHNFKTNLSEEEKRALKAFMVTL